MPDVTFETTVNPDGTYSVDTGAETPTTGTFPMNLGNDDTLDITVTDPGGNSDTSSVTIDTTAPTVDEVATNETTPTITGTGETGETITVEIDTDGDGMPDVTFETTVDPDGTFSVDTGAETPTIGTFPTGLDNGDTLDVTVTDPSGNTDTSSVTIDTTAPTVDDLATNDLTPEITGLGEPGEVITIEIDADGDGTPDVTYETTVATNGIWTLNPDIATPTSGLFPTLENDDTLDITITDPAGNTDTATVSIDTTSPTLNETPVDSTMPAITGTGDPGETITVEIDTDGDGMPDVTFETTVDPDGTYSVDTATDTPIDGAFPTDLDDDTVIEVTVTDEGGNTDMTAIEIDLTGPTIDDSSSNDTTPTLIGTAEPGETITVEIDTDGDGMPDVTYETTAGPAGQWTIEPDTQLPTSGAFPTDLVDGDSIDIIVTDSAGNTDTAVLTIDTVAPMIDEQTTNETAPTITGTGEPGEMLTVEIDTDGDGMPDVTFETTVPPDGTYSVDTATDTPIDGTFPTDLGNGTVIGVTVTDPAGNENMTTVSINTEAPTVDGLATNDPTPTITGTGEPGETLTVELDTDGDGNPNVTFETIVSPDGTYAVDPDTDTPITGTFPTNLGDGTAIEITVTDPAGNQDTATISVTLVADLAIAQSIVGEPVLTELGNYVVTFQTVVENTGTVDLASLSLLENLSAQFGTAFANAGNLILASDPSDPASSIAVNSATWNGGSFSQIIDNSTATLLATGDSFTVQFDVEINPREISVPLENQVEGLGSGVDGNGNPILDSANTPVIAIDLSDSGIDPETTNPNAPGDQGTSNDPTLIELPPVPLGSISGTVFQDDNDDGFQQLNEIGIERVEVTLTGADVLGNNVQTTIFTDAFGRYFFEGLNAGDYSISQTQPEGFTDGIDIGSNGLITSINDVSSDINLSFGETIENVTFAEQLQTPGVGGNPPNIPGLGPILNSPISSLINGFVSGPGPIYSGIPINSNADALSLDSGRAVSGGYSVDATASGVEVWESLDPTGESSGQTLDWAEELIEQPVDSGGEGEGIQVTPPVPTEEQIVPEGSELIDAEQTEHVDQAEIPLPLLTEATLGKISFLKRMSNWLPF